MIAIFAPHADDEVIGCFSLLERAKKFDEQVVVVYGSLPKPSRKLEARAAAERLGFEQIVAVDQPFWEVVDAVVCEAEICWAPDPHFEWHPAHKSLGAIVRDACNNAATRFGVYSTNMNVPYLRELDPFVQARKRDTLNICYPSQRKLWEHDWRYFLFEGMAEWNPA